MKRGTIEHPKTLHLAGLLRIPRLHAVGLLESLWHFTAKYAPRGDVGQYENATIAEGIYWGGDADRMVEALLSAKGNGRSGWLDPSPTHRLSVHDWHEHADQAVRKWLDRKGLTFVGVTAEKSGQSTASVRTVSGQSTASVRTVDSLPEPEPEPEPIPPTPQGVSEMGDSEKTLLLRWEGWVAEIRELPGFGQVTVEQLVLVARGFPEVPFCRDTIQALIVQAKKDAPIRNAGGWLQRFFQAESWKKKKRAIVEGAMPAKKRAYVPLAKREEEEGGENRE